MPNKRGNVKKKQTNRRQAKKNGVKRIDYSADDRFGQKPTEDEEDEEEQEGSEQKSLVLQNGGQENPSLENKAGPSQDAHVEAPSNFSSEAKITQEAPKQGESRALVPKDLLLLAEMNDSNVTELNLGNQDHFGNGGAKHVASVLVNNTHVRLLWLNDDQIKDAGIKQIAKMIHDNISLTEIDLSNNLIEDLGAEALAKALSYNWRVVKMDVRGNQISVEHIEKINKMLLSPVVLRQALPRLHENDPTLRCLEMPQSLLQDSDLEGLMHAMSDSKHVTRLLLSRNHIGGAGAHAISKALQTKEEVSVNGVEHIHCAVHTVDLNENNVGVRGAKELAAVMRNNITLHTLYLADNAIGPEGAACLASALLENSTLKRLFLDRNGIGDKGAIALGNAFDKEHNDKVNTTLDTLWLTDNDIGRDGATKLRWALRIFDGPVSTLLLDGNEGVIKM